MSMQMKDIVFFDGKPYSLISPERNTIIDFVKEFGVKYYTSSSAGHGCDPVYEIKDGKLFLETLHLFLGNSVEYPMIYGIVPAETDQIPFSEEIAACTFFETGKIYKNIGHIVSSYSGDIVIGRNYDSRNSPGSSGPYDELFLTRIRLSFVEGILVGKEDIPEEAEERRKEFKDWWF